MIEAKQENKEYLTQQIITYIGNKRALLGFLAEALDYIKSDISKDKLTIGDFFSGSGIVSRFFKADASYIAANDLEGYSHTMNRCYLSNKGDLDMSELSALYDGLVKTLGEGLCDGFISRLYSPRDERDIKPGERVFYTPRNARYIDTARQAIARLDGELQPYFLAPLLTEASVKTNTSGVFKGFYKNSRTGVGQFGGDGKDALRRILCDISLPFPVFSNFDCAFDVFKQDANSLAGTLGPLDLVYLDPPYNQHPYGSNYFMLNLINDYTEPQRISPVSGIPHDWNRSDYNKSRTAFSVLCELCQKARARYLLISFNSEGFTGVEQMERMLSQIGRLKVFERRYNAFRGSRNLHGRDLHTKEYLFLVKK